MTHLNNWKTPRSALLERLPWCFETETPWRKLCKHESHRQPSSLGFAFRPHHRLWALPRIGLRLQIVTSRSGPERASLAGSSNSGSASPPLESGAHRRGSFSSTTILPLPLHRRHATPRTPSATGVFTNLLEAETGGKGPTKVQIATFLR